MKGLDILNFVHYDYFPKKTKRKFLKFAGKEVSIALTHGTNPTVFNCSHC